MASGAGQHLEPLSIGEKILILRWRKQWQQKQLSKALGIHRNTVGLIERGLLLHPSGTIVQRLAEVLGVPTDFLLKKDKTFGMTD
jgi:transcriptional regulator with XRE-family HTH domain